MYVKDRSSERTFRSVAPGFPSASHCMSKTRANRATPANAGFERVDWESAFS